MNKLIGTFLATLSLLVSSGGCSGMKNFLFGRGAACASCATTAPSYTPYIQAEPTCGHEPVCGYEPSCGHEPVCGYEAAPMGLIDRLHSGCGLLAGRGTCGGSSNCNCSSATQTYMNPVVDPYAGVVQDPYSYSGEVIGSQVIGDVYNGYPAVTSDNFDARGGNVINSVPAPMPVPQSNTANP